jgi:hypothetical protein
MCSRSEENHEKTEIGYPISSIAELLITQRRYPATFVIGFGKLRGKQRISIGKSILGET